MKKSILKLACALLIVSFTASYSFGQWLPTNFPTHTPWTVFATNSGKLIVTDFASSADVYISENLGSSFSKSNLNSIYTAKCSTSDYIFLGGSGPNIARSSDNGNSWEVFNFGHLFELVTPDCYAIEVHNNKLFAAVFEGGIAYSEDDGVSWELTDVNSLIVNSVIDGRYTYSLRSFKGTLYALGATGIFKYNDQTNDWTFIKETLYASNSVILNDKMFVGHSAPNGPFFILRTDDGENWEEIAAPGSVETNDCRAIGAYNGVLYAGAMKDGIYYSTNEGYTWTSFSSGFPQVFFQDYATPLDFDFIGDTVFVSGYHETKGGLFKAQIPVGVPNKKVEESNYLIFFDQTLNTISIIGDYKTAEISIYSPTGQILFNKKLSQNEKSIYIGEIKLGIYLYKIIFDKNSSVGGKIIK